MQLDEQKGPGNNKIQGSYNNLKKNITCFTQYCVGTYFLHKDSFLCRAARSHKLLSRVCSQGIGPCVPKYKKK